jgi:hypothetical protein
MKAEEFAQKFDAGEDITAYIKVWIAERLEQHS